MTEFVYRIASKRLKNDAGDVVRKNFDAFDLPAALPAATSEEKKEQLWNKLLSNSIKEIVQEKERHLWLTSETKPYDDDEPLAIASWWKDELEKVSFDTVWEKETLRAAPVNSVFGIRKWRQWLRVAFFPALAVHRGDAPLTTSQAKAAFDILSLGRGMTETQKASFNHRLQEMLATGGESVNGFLAVDATLAAVRWINETQVEPETDELDI